ncbi:S9 family peptidase [Salisaeta longa]|uniref:S9 family peptidase n=1 Tax=Salisaeta longa TaxID=503170 RepID=UPI0003B751CD|nr:prolyl oligopeptidase family serine peptidase [Salisaeta longa]
MRLLCCLLALLVAGPLHAQPQPTAPPEPPEGPWSIKDVLKQRSLSQVDIGPQGQRILWVKRVPDFEEDRTTSDVYLTYRDDPNGGTAPATVRLTRSGNNSAPQWSPDGTHIAFRSSRATETKEDDGPQIWLMDARGGAPYPVTSLPHGAGDFQWRSNDELLVVARAKDTRYEQALKDAKDDAIVIEDTSLYYPTRLLRVNVHTQEVTRASNNQGRIRDVAVAPGGRYVVYSIDPSPVDADARRQPLQYLLDLQTGTRTELFTGQYFDPENYTWTPDGAGFYATDSFSSDPEHEGAGITELYYFTLADRSYQKVPLNWPNGVGYGGYAVTDDGVHVQLADGPLLKPRFYRKTAAGWQPQPIDDARLQHSTSFSIGPRGETVVFSHSTADTPPVYRVGSYARGTIRDEETLVTLNAYLDAKPIPRAEVVRWQGANGDTVNGILHYPLNYSPDRRYPLVTVIHGGPSGVDLDAWRLGWTVYAPLWAQRGAFVFRPNYHGSGHHGLAFVESIKGKYYELEIPDIVQGIQHLADEGLVDTDSLGVMGWSNGAILTIQLTVEHPELFTVAAPGAGDVNWTSDYGNCAFGARFDNSYFKGPPWEFTQHYIEKSPLFEMEKVITPTLIHFGTEDRAVPSEQGWEHYRALQQIGKAPVRYLRYPGEPHGFRRLSHQRRKVEEDLKWFDTYLFDTTSMEERVADRLLADTAPLARLERHAPPAMADGRYGVMQDGRLLPEMVALGDSLLVGRFEVTQAQWAAYSETSVPAGRANHPAHGLTAAQAQAYVDWLNAQTGASYRLPTQAEAKALQKQAGASENTPAYWAGYTPTADAYERIRARLLRQSPATLLMPVGSRPPGSADGVLLYDLNGNVAEWATTSSGAVPTGASAVTLTPTWSPDAPAVPPAYRGLRVVREAP